MARAPKTALQGSLFAADESGRPSGLDFREEFVTPAEEGARVGWRYDFNQARVERAPPIPDFLLPLRERAAGFAGLAPAAFEQGLVIRYDVGAGVGWHRDRPVRQRVCGRW